MLRIISRILKLADEFAGKIKLAFFFSFGEGIFINMPIFAILYILNKVVGGSLSSNDAWVSGGIALAGLIGQYICKRLVYSLQSGSGYHIFSRERIKSGDRFKRLPMGFFSEGNLGNITAVITSDLTFIEMYSMGVIDKIVNGYVSITIGCIFLLILDYRIALISLAVTGLAIIVLNRMQTVGKEQSYLRQKTQAELVAVVLEYVQGIAVSKAFNLTGVKAKATKEAFAKTRDKAIEFEKKFIPLVFTYESVFSLGIALTIFGVTSFGFNGSLNLSTMLLLLIFIFRIYLPIKASGGLSGQIRIMEAVLDRYAAIKKIEVIDEDGKDVDLKRFDIEFAGVSFAYEKKDVLKNISFKIPADSMTALVGASGSGKTTIANLIARFWDVQEGEVRVGGVNVKAMSCDSLLKNISMVFQKVYLFNDTILNNIKFGKPDVSMEEVITAAKKARCHDFIMELKDGYETMVEEGGASLSGGEKQRISIARAILKDAPIILLDEATASVDPDNEGQIQSAISELVQDKTLVVIAHKLSTIKNADQILVVDQGRISQRGTHRELIEEEGLYHDFWQRRVKARSWKIERVRV